LPVQRVARLHDIRPFLAETRRIMLLSLHSPLSYFQIGANYLSTV
jgi:hypothetical protein